MNFSNVLSTSALYSASPSYLRTENWLPLMSRQYFAADRSALTFLVSATSEVKLARTRHISSDTRGKTRARAILDSRAARSRARRSTASQYASTAFRNQPSLTCLLIDPVRYASESAHRAHRSGRRTGWRRADWGGLELLHYLVTVLDRARRSSGERGRRAAGRTPLFRRGWRPRPGPDSGRRSNQGPQARLRAVLRPFKQYAV